MNSYAEQRLKCIKTLQAEFLAGVEHDRLVRLATGKNGNLKNHSNWWNHFSEWLVKATHSTGTGGHHGGLRGV
jgi:hypothetical protein